MDDGENIKFLRAVRIVILGLSIFYLLQLASPLRLNTDAVVFLSLAESFINGHGFLYKGMPSHFPPGYPALLSLLDFVGLSYSWGFIAANIIFLAIGNIILFYICRKKLRFNKTYSYIVIILSLLSWVMIKHITLPLSDITFYGLSMGAIGALSYAETAENKYRKFFFVIGIFLACLAVTVRTIGIAIFVAIVFKTLYKKMQENKSSLFKLLRTHKVLLIVLSVAMISTIIALINTRYFEEGLKTYYDHGGFLRGILFIWVNRLLELGELSVNISIAKIPNIMIPIIMIIGLAFLGVIIYVFYYRQHNLIILDFYVIAYLLIIFFWPYNDSRFWLPIVPLVISLVAIFMEKVSFSRLLTAGLCAYIMIFSLMGLAALGYSTRISLADSRFPDLYTNHEELRNTYRIFLSNKDMAKELHGNEVLHLLRRFSKVRDEKKFGAAVIK
jgi:hypothetical protein